MIQLAVLGTKVSAIDKGGVVSCMFAIDFPYSSSGQDIK